MVSRVLFSILKRNSGPFSSKFKSEGSSLYKVCGFSMNSRTSFGKGIASFLLLASATTAALCLQGAKDSASDSLWETSINLSPQLHQFLRDLWHHELQHKYQSAVLTDLSASENWGRFIIDAQGANSLPSTYFQSESQNNVGSCTSCHSNCLTRSSIADAAAKVAPAVVNLTVTQGIRGMFLGRSIGSGTIVDSNGTLITNAHVVADITSAGVSQRGKITVTLQDGRSFEGEIINADLSTDIAVVRINSKTPLPSAKLGSSNKLRVGDWVVAVGCPLFLQNTVTAGIVSCVDRKSSELGLGGLRRDYLQTDCPINQGNSGGPLVNLDGEVVGVNTMKVQGADGLSFAIPIDSIIKIVGQLQKYGRTVRPWLGLKMLELNELMIVQLKEKVPSFPDITHGVLVPQVIPGSPAVRAGFCSGDVVVQFDGKPVKTVSEILEILGDKVGVAFKVVVMRPNNQQVTLTIVPEEASPSL